MISPFSYRRPPIAARLCQKGANRKYFATSVMGALLLIDPRDAVLAERVRPVKKHAAEFLAQEYVPA
jgi:hypothetical protein